jgi:hypothetical protein
MHLPEENSQIPIPLFSNSQKSLNPSGEKQSALTVSFSTFKVWI